MKRHYIESTNAIRIINPTAPIQSNKVTNHNGSLKCSVNSFKSFILF